MSHYEKQIENWVNAGETNDRTEKGSNQGGLARDFQHWFLSLDDRDAFEFWEEYTSGSDQNERLKEVMKKAEGLLHDPVNHPTHYTNHKSGIECIQVTEYMNFCLGNAVKCIWRAGIKSDTPVEDLQKAIWYINREIERIK